MKYVVKFPKKYEKLIKEIKEKERIDMGEVIRRALSLYHNLRCDESGRVKEILVLRHNGNITHINMAENEYHKIQLDLCGYLAQNYKQEEIKKITIEKQDGELEEILVKDILPK